MNLLNLFFAKENVKVWRTDEKMWCAASFQQIWYWTRTRASRLLSSRVLPSWPHIKYFFRLTRLESIQTLIIYLLLTTMYGARFPFSDEPARIGHKDPSNPFTVCKFLKGKRQEGVFAGGIRILLDGFRPQPPRVNHAVNRWVRG